MKNAEEVANDLAVYSRRNSVGCVELKDAIAKALQDAYLKGAEDMRERAMELEALLAQGLKLMELINGPENKCAYGNGAGSQCKNHQWINDVYAAMKEGK